MHLPSTLLALFTLLSLPTTTLATTTTTTHLQRRQDSPTPTSTEYTDDTAFQSAILTTTNLYRRQHNASQLAWNESLAATAKEWSDACAFKHSGGPAGENLASGYPNATASVEAWGDERGEYDFEEGEFA